MILLTIGLFILNFFVLVRLAMLYVGKGSDHYFYKYYIGCIKINKHRLFSVFPFFLNKPYITDPQFFFWLLSYFSAESIKRIALLLNPSLITTVGVTVLVFLRQEFSYDYKTIFLIVLATFMTPQFFYGQNARIYGLNSRGIGLLLMIFFFICVYYIVIYNTMSIAFLCAILIGYLIWGSSLFAQQALILFTVVSWILWGWYKLPVILLLSVVLFYALHPRYARNYFKSRWKYLLIYKNVFSDRFILRLRYSIWRDFVYDFWFFKRDDIKKHFLYIYNNGAIAISFLNPLLMYCIYVYFFQKQYIEPGFNLFLIKLILTGVVIFILTSFRFSRLIGEPERYVEILIPFINIAAIPVIYNLYGTGTLFYIFGAFFVINLLQVLIYVKSLKKTSNKLLNTVCEIKNAINSDADKNEGISFFCNNLNWSNFFLDINWRYVYYYPTQYYLSDIHVRELIKEYPYISNNYVEKIVDYYNVSYILIDKRNSSVLTFEFSNMKIISQGNDYILLKCSL